MIMPLDELLQRLINVTPSKKSFISVYLDLSPDGSGKKLHTVFLKNRLPELTNILPAHSPDRSFLAQDIKRIQKYLEEDLDPARRHPADRPVPVCRVAGAAAGLAEAQRSAGL